MIKLVNGAQANALYSHVVLLLIVFAVPLLCDSRRSSSQRSLASDVETIYTLEYCSKYLCSAYSAEMASYFKSGCDVNFTALLPTDEDEASSTVTGASLFFLSVVSFVGSLLAGVILGKNARSIGA